jgi:hypothetical protein
MLQQVVYTFWKFNFTIKHYVIYHVTSEWVPILPLVSPDTSVDKVTS